MPSGPQRRRAAGQAPLTRRLSRRSGGRNASRRTAAEADQGERPAESSHRSPQPGRSARRPVAEVDRFPQFPLAQEPRVIALAASVGTSPTREGRAGRAAVRAPRRRDSAPATYGVLTGRTERGLRPRPRGTRALRIPWGSPPVWVRFPPPAPYNQQLTAVLRGRPPEAAICPADNPLTIATGSYHPIAWRTTRPWS